MKLVLTGGPSGGKTTLAQALQKEFNSRVALVPEAATILFAGGWPRKSSQLSVRHQQRAIYGLQKELEYLFIDEHPDRLLICDRGSLDGMAYWPGPGPATDLLKEMGSTIEQELRRYDWIIHLDTAPTGHYDLGNPIRIESYAEAQKLNERILDAWSMHPKRIIIMNHDTGHFLAKLEKALLAVRHILDGKSYAEVCALVAEIK